MLDKKTRVSVGQTVADIAVHYYAGLSGRSVEEAEEVFKKAVLEAYPLAECALRLAEHEATHG